MRRSTPSAAAASTASRGASALTLHTASAGRVATIPAPWNTRRAPRNARRSAARSSTSACTAVTATSPSRVSRAGSRWVTLTSAPRSASSRATCAPINPVAPVTVTRVPGYSYGAWARLLESERVRADIDPMPHRSRLILLALGACLFAAAPARAAEFVPGEVIVQPDGEGPAEVVQVDRGETVKQAVAELSDDPDVEYAVPNYKARASVIWNDPGRSGEPSGWTNMQWNFIGDASINAPDAWDLAAAMGAPGGRGAIVAVVDTGAAYRTRGRFKRAPDLRRRTFVPGYDFVDDDRRPFDLFGHGTHVAGTIAQHVNNGIAVTGLAYNAKIMPIRVLNENGEGGAYDIARGIRYAAKHGADVVNLSLEFAPSITARQVPGIIRAIRFAHRKGAVVVAAAGNASDASVAYPARARYAISVGATTERLCQADYSNSGTSLDVVAPGGGNDAPNDDNPLDAQNCRPNLTGRDIYQQTFVRNPRSFGLPGGYQGTSMAAPHVSAIAALVIATKRLGKRPRPRRVAAHLRDTARDLGATGYDSRYGHGLVDAAAALR